MKHVSHWLTSVATVSILLGMTMVAAAQSEPGQPNGLGGLFGASPGGNPSVVAIEAQFTAPKSGQPGRLVLSAKIAPGYHIYSITQSAGGPVATKIVVNALRGIHVGRFQAATEPDRKQEPLFDNLTVETHQGTVTWSAPLELDAGIDPATLQITGTVTFAGVRRQLVPAADARKVCRSFGAGGRPGERSGVAEVGCRGRPAEPAAGRAVRSSHAVDADRVRLAGRADPEPDALRPAGGEFEDSGVRAAGG